MRSTAKHPSNGRVWIDLYDIMVVQVQVQRDEKRMFPVRQKNFVRSNENFEEDSKKEKENVSFLGANTKVDTNSMLSVIAQRVASKNCHVMQPQR